MNWAGRRALVIGLGKSGVAAARFLVAAGARVTVADRRSAESLADSVRELADCDLSYHFGGHPEGLLAAQDLIVPSPGVPWDLPELRRARERGIAVCGEVELAAGALRGRTIGVTGTNGKTTTATLIDHVLRSAGVPGRLAGNIGTPVLAVVEQSRRQDWHVLELSSFQLEAARSLRCHVAVVLNVTPDHLDRHGTFQRYWAAKARILRNQARRDWAVLNASDPGCRHMEPRAAGEVVRYRLRCGQAVDSCAAGGRIRFRGEDVGRSDLPIPGAHNLENALAATAACRLAGVPARRIGRSLQSFRAVPHRMEFVKRVGGVGYFNDSKATNVAAAAKACGSFRSGLWAILGGRDKGSDFRPLGDVLRPRARAALLVGEAAPLIRRQIGSSVPVQEVGTLEEAVRQAGRRASPGDTVLLAPACASFDQYASYIQRGREFRRLVGRLEG